MKKRVDARSSLFTRLQPHAAETASAHCLPGLRTLDFLLLGLVLLALASALSSAFPVGRPVYDLFRLNSDSNIPAWYSSILLAIAALLAFQCRNSARNTDARKAFLTLGGLMLLMSCDEVVRLHETIPSYLAALLALKELEAFAGRRWLLLGAPIVLVLLLSVLLMVDRNLRSHSTERVLMLLGFAAILFGGLLLEALAAITSGTGVIRFLLVHVEESLEMFGTLLICASLVLVRDRQLQG